MKVSRIAHEKKTVELMIRLYCRKKEKTRFFVPTVKSCFAMRMPVSTVVRLERKGCMQRVHSTLLQACPARTNATGNAFSGPRMLFYAPWQTIRHLLNL